MRTRRLGSFVALAVIAGGISSARADIAYGTDPFHNRLFEVNLATGALSNSVPISLAGFTVTGATALTANPLDGTVWGIVKTASGSAGRMLVTINPTSGEATLVGAVPDGFSTLSFNSAGTLYGMTGNGGFPPSTLYTLSTVNAAATVVYGPVISGPDGEVIAFGPGDTLYHSSGNNTATFSIINLGPNTTTPLGSAPGEMYGMGYSSGTMFCTDINSELSSVNLSNGARTFIGDTRFVGGDFVGVRGLAIVRPVPPACYPNCDHSTAAPCLNVQDFSCFLNAFAAGETYANCDSSTTPPVLNVQDFACFLNTFAAGCSSC